MQETMVLYGLVAALTAVNAWSRHSQATDIVSSEATAIASVWRDLGGYPQRERDSMRETLRGYMNQIIQEAWARAEPGPHSACRSGVDGPLPGATPGVRAHFGIAENSPCHHVERLQPHARSAPPAAGCCEQPTAGSHVDCSSAGAMGCLLFSLFFPIEEPHFQPCWSLA
jgi:hypothetical protein